ncbi:MAG: zinc-ribbon domain-containing protein [Tardiphaga sp.]|nr:zinc-ribbon domain-containing protein [Tardiphaga sp.]
MHIVCPNCTTSYAVNPASFGDSGRTVRCARCKEVWLARPEDLARTELRAPAMANPAPDEDLSAWGITEDEAESTPERDIPRVESPSISAGWPAEANDPVADWSTASDDELAPSRFARATRFAALRRLVPKITLRIPFLPRISLPVACAAMSAMVLALMIWRVEMVRLLPQTATFYQLVGLNVNLRALAFKDVKVSTETVEGKQVLVIEGNIVSESRGPVQMPRLRFVVRDDKGTEIYAWNAVIEQPGLNPGDKAWFRSRLASPPADSRSIDVRFFNKRDIGSGA